MTGITISPEQQRRATNLAAERGVANAKFELCDALDMKYPDNSFDLVWACESGEHMPDKEKYVQEMARVLKPGLRAARCYPRGRSLRASTAVSCASCVVVRAAPLALQALTATRSVGTHTAWCVSLSESATPTVDLR